MTELQTTLLHISKRRPGVTDRQSSEALCGSDRMHQQVNAEFRLLASAGYVERRVVNGVIGNFYVA